MKTKDFIINAIIPTLVIVGICVNEAYASQVNDTITTTTTSYVKTEIVSEKPKFAERGKPRASDVYWYRMAKCETRLDWQNGGRYAGGLGIMTAGKFKDRNKGTWERWGGEDFAPSPDKATIEEQILIANRISTQGYVAFKKRDPKVAKQKGVPIDYLYVKPPTGFDGWGCMKIIGKPILFTKPPYYLVYAKFKYKEHSARVKRLQQFIGVSVDGYYGPRTRKAHAEFKKKYGAILLAEKNKYQF